MQSVENKPCLVQTGRGFSVKYKERLLYSKYNPQKSILQTVQDIEILPGTLVLCISPCLGFGLEELSKKLSLNSRLFGIEYDSGLFDFTKEHCKELECTKNGAFTLIEQNALATLPETLNSADSIFRGMFRRVVRIDFSAGTAFCQNFYDIFHAAMQNSVAQFWKNRITLVKFGRRYSRNFFRNLAAFPKEHGLQDFSASVTKPILVLGAGESLENLLSADKEVLGGYFIIAADACLSALKTAGIKTDAAVCEESQITIAKAFIGCKNYARLYFSSLSSCAGISEQSERTTVFYTTIFDDTNFIRRLTDSRLLPKAVPPLGSVGLAAVYIALILRASPDVPVFVCGLDFSYQAGKTHARSTFPVISRSAHSSRLNPINNYHAAFSNGAFFTRDKNGNITVTTKNLEGYAGTFRQFFSGTRNLFDCARTGLPLGLKAVQIEQQESAGKEIPPVYSNRKPDGLKLEAGIKLFFEQEITALKELRNILSHGQNIEKTERDLRIKKLLENREYLYLHFPDGISSSLDIGFLKRIRAETDYFIKLFNQLHCP